MSDLPKSGNRKIRMTVLAQVLGTLGFAGCLLLIHFGNGTVKPSEFVPLYCVFVGGVLGNVAVFSGANAFVHAKGQVENKTQ